MYENRLTVSKKLIEREAKKEERRGRGRGRDGGKEGGREKEETKPLENVSQQGYLPQTEE